MKLFNKYEYQEQDIKKRGYSQTCVVHCEDGKFFAKWIVGVDKQDVKIRIFEDNLRHLQGVKHPSLPKIIEYGFDNFQNNFAVVFEYLSDCKQLDECDLDENILLSGIIGIANCLKVLWVDYQIVHGDITPANILVDSHNRFYITDFCLTDLTTNLSQEKSLQIFAQQYAAPEKFDSQPCVQPFLSDIYSLGKVIQSKLGDIQGLEKLTEKAPQDRPNNWTDTIETLSTYYNVLNVDKYIHIEKCPKEFVAILNNPTSNILFNVDPKIMEGSNNFVMNLVANDLKCKVLWITDEKKLLVLDRPVSEAEKKDKYYAQKLPFRLMFSEQFIDGERFDLTPEFQRMVDEKNTKNNSYKLRKEQIDDKLDFYSELIKKEIYVLEQKSFHIKYSDFKTENNFEIWFKIKADNTSLIDNHIEKGNDVDSDGFEYEIKSEKKNEKPVKFSGKPYNFEKIKSANDNKQDTENVYWLKIKDCEGVKFDELPKAGVLAEDITIQTEEKRRQSAAIQKVAKREVLNSDLLYYLFEPDKYQPVIINSDDDIDVQQKDSNGKSLIYSHNQKLAISNSVNCNPLSVIQGPPGTGKTTVITEIIFQILLRQPSAKILVTSQTNNAVDQVLETLIKNKISVVRLNGIAMPKNEKVKQRTISKIFDNWIATVINKSKQNIEKERQQFLDSVKDDIVLSGIAEIFFKEEDWAKRRNKIENLLGRFSGKKYLEIKELPETECEAAQKIGRVLNEEFYRCYQKYELNKDWRSTVSTLDRQGKMIDKFIDSINVVGATCNHIAAKKYNKYNFEFDYVIMDESGKATIAESLVPIVLAKKLIFVGDHRQLRPTLTNTTEVNQWLKKKYKEEASEMMEYDEYFNRPSLFEEVITHISNNAKVQLADCRRMPKLTVNLTSKHFYESEGDNKINYVERDSKCEHNLPLKTVSPLFFLDIGNTICNKKDSNQSSYNETSAQKVVEILKCLNKFDAVKQYSIGVITGYSAQSRLLRREIDKIRYGNRKLKTVFDWDNKNEDKFRLSVIDKFQGLECDIIILDLVKSGTNIDLGFLKVPNRINVALSRHKKLLIIVGDYYGITNASVGKGYSKCQLQNYLNDLDDRIIVKNVQEIF